MLANNGQVEWALQELGAAWQQSWKKLEALVGEAGFTERYDDAYFYTIEPLDKNAVPALTIGADVPAAWRRMERSSPPSSSASSAPLGYLLSSGKGMTFA